MQADLEHSNQLVADYAAEIAGLQEKGNAAQITIAAAPVTPIAPGCPDPCLFLLCAPLLAGCLGSDPSPQLSAEKPVLVQRQAPAELTRGDAELGDGVGLRRRRLPGAE